MLITRKTVCTILYLLAMVLIQTSYADDVAEGICTDMGAQVSALRGSLEEALGMKVNVSNNMTFVGSNSKGLDLDIKVDNTQVDNEKLFLSMKNNLSNELKIIGMVAETNGTVANIAINDANDVDTVIKADENIVVPVAVGNCTKNKPTVIHIYIAIEKSLDATGQEREVDLIRFNVVASCSAEGTWIGEIACGMLLSNLKFPVGVKLISIINKISSSSLTTTVAAAGVATATAVGATWCIWKFCWTRRNPGQPGSQNLGGGLGGDDNQGGGGRPGNMGLGGPVNLGSGDSSSLVLPPAPPSNAFLLTQTDTQRTAQQVAAARRAEAERQFYAQESGITAYIAIAATTEIMICRALRNGGCYTEIRDRLRELLNNLVGLLRDATTNELQQREIAQICTELFEAFVLRLRVDLQDIQTLNEENVELIANMVTNGRDLVRTNRDQIGKFRDSITEAVTIFLALEHILTHGDHDQQEADKIYITFYNPFIMIGSDILIFKEAVQAQIAQAKDAQKKAEEAAKALAEQERQRQLDAAAQAQPPVAGTGQVPPTAQPSSVAALRQQLQGQGLNGEMMDRSATAIRHGVTYHPDHEEQKKQ